MTVTVTGGVLGAPAGAGVTSPSTPAPTVPVSEAPAVPETPPVEPAAPETPPPPNPAAEVIERRQGQALAKLMREKQQLDAQREQLKGHEPRLTLFAKAEKLAAEGDHAGAHRFMLEATYGGADKAKAALPALYESLTSEILGVDSKSSSPRIERDVARLQRELEELKQARATAEAERDEWQSKDRENRVEAAVSALSTMLEAETTSYPYLMAEADDPGHVVWEIMVAAIERGEEPPEPEEAAKLANLYYQPVFERKKTKYQNLLAPQGASGSTSTLEAPQSLPAPQRKSLTNADAAQAPNLTAPRVILDREKSIDEAWRVLQQGHKQT